ncbi:hypothetical protein BRADI_4g41488v3 [Brachypodium distachyon]|uniref:Reverse transcriptase zinc-binding domain-containing protein n=1 Tax=Brachypodium distachyon TaxID=15368 RepID=A0A2K2CTM5_BRADI|nr:hypothetical protein BRADI_4g41488v3 [Brachypodium distachyon]
MNGLWLEDVGPNLTTVAIAEFLTLWEWLRDVQLGAGVDDVLVWNWAKDGVYSAKTAYANLFIGRKDFLTAFTLVFWIIWRHRNNIVFNGVSPSVHWVLSTVREELDRWCSAGLIRNRGVGLAFAATE